jgi:DNA invertase Pin-like site-specific DNA recombinase
LGKAFFTLAAMFAELERATLIERVKAGMARARAEGKRIGRPARSTIGKRLRLVQGVGSPQHDA